jgi:hypothetical protein
MYKVITAEDGKRYLEFAMVTYKNIDLRTLYDGQQLDDLSIFNPIPVYQIDDLLELADVNRVSVMRLPLPKEYNVSLDIYKGSEILEFGSDEYKKEHRIQKLLNLKHGI